MAGETYGFVVEGLDTLEDLRAFGEKVDFMAVQAINKIAASARTRLAKEIGSQINFPASYLAPGQNRLVVSQKATRASLEAHVFARGRATSLARFATSRDPSRRSADGVGVAVRKGGAVQQLRGAFLIKLRSGNSDTDTLGNLGLAVRVKRGQSLRNKKINAKPIFPGVFLLYGPSVYQAFESVAESIGDDVLLDLESEFFRLRELKLQ